MRPADADCRRIALENQTAGERIIFVSAVKAVYPDDGIEFFCYENLFSECRIKGTRKGMAESSAIPF